VESRFKGETRAFRGDFKTTGSCTTAGGGLLTFIFSLIQSGALGGSFSHSSAELAKKFFKQRFHLQAPHRPSIARQR